MKVKRILAGLGALAVAGGAAIAIPGSAMAEERDQRRSCQSGEFCVWYYSDYEDIEIYDSGDNGNWPDRIANDDMSWKNEGVSDPGVDHVRVYSSDYATGEVTLCVHTGASGTAYSGDADDQDDLQAAANRGNGHYWGGECGSSEPQVD